MEFIPQFLECTGKSWGQIRNQQTYTWRRSKVPGYCNRYKLTSGTKRFWYRKRARAALYNNVEALMEYKFMHAIEKIVSEKKPIIGYALGHGEAFRL